MDNNERNTGNPERGWFLLIAVLSFLNIIVIPTLNRSLYFSAFVPMIAVTYGMYFLTSTAKWVAIYGLGLGSAIFYFLCWVFSRRHHLWTYAGAIMYSIDAAVMVYYIFTSGFNVIWVLDLLFHAMVLLFVYRCAWEGRKEYLQERALKQYQEADSDDEIYSLDDENEESEDQMFSVETDTDEVKEEVYSLDDESEESEKDVRNLRYEPQDTQEILFSVDDFNRSKKEVYSIDDEQEEIEDQDL